MALVAECPEIFVAVVVTVSHVVNLVTLAACERDAAELASVPVAREDAWPDGCCPVWW